MVLYLVAVLAGFLAGLVNVVSGGGSMISMPALIYGLGLSSVDANATNRLAIVLQNVVAVWRFRTLGLGEWRSGVLLGLAACPGAVLGAIAAARMDEADFRVVMGGVFLLILVSMFWTPESWVRTTRPARPALLLAAFFLLGFYGGFIQAGIGVLILIALVQLGGRDLVSGNAVKVIAVFVYSIPAFLAFVAEGRIRFVPGLALSIGHMAGAWVGATLSVRKGERFIRWVTAAVVLASAADLLGVRRWIG